MNLDFTAGPSLTKTTPPFTAGSTGTEGHLEKAVDTIDIHHQPTGPSGLEEAPLSKIDTTKPNPATENYFLKQDAVKKSTMASGPKSPKKKGGGIRIIEITQTSPTRAPPKEDEPVPTKGEAHVEIPKPLVAEMEAPQKEEVASVQNTTEAPALANETEPPAAGDTTTESEKTEPVPATTRKPDPPEESSLVQEAALAGNNTEPQTMVARPDPPEDPPQQREVATVPEQAAPTPVMTERKSSTSSSAAAAAAAESDEIQKLYEQLRLEKERAARLEAERDQHKKDAEDYKDRLDQERSKASETENPPKETPPQIEEAPKGPETPALAVMSTETEKVAKEAEESEASAAEAAKPEENAADLEGSLASLGDAVVELTTAADDSDMAKPGDVAQAKEDDNVVEAGSTEPTKEEEEAPIEDSISSLQDLVAPEPTQPSEPRSPPPERKKVPAKKPSDATKKKKKSATAPKRQSAPQSGGRPSKPKMDLRHILAKHEKKPEESKPANDDEVDFYGSMSAIPFLKKPAEKKKKGKKPKKKSEDKPKQQTEEEALLAQGEKNSNGVVIIKDYTEDELKLWKSMSALDTGDIAGERPPDMLPLRARVRPKKELGAVDLAKHQERAHNRPDVWLNPHLKTPEKMTYKLKVDEKDKEEILKFSPAGSAERLHDSMASMSSRGSVLSAQDEEYKATSNASHGDMSRPGEMLPLSPGKRKSQPKRPSKHRVVGQNRPQEWLSPGKKTSPTSPSFKIKRELTPGEVEEEGLQTMPAL